MKTSSDNSNWMGSLPENVKNNVPLGSLSIPGSHDSLTYSLVKTGSAGPDQPSWIQKLTKMFPKISSHILYRWSVTQELDVIQQLDLGIRFDKVNFSF